MTHSPVVGRLAPSPTGYLHLGHARSFLLAYWSVRSQGGRLLLRLEDLDAERSSQRFVDATLADLEWLGIEWDGEAHRQSLGLSRIRELAYALLERGRAYPCTCTRADLRASANAPQQGAAELRYDGRCRSRFPDLSAAERASPAGAAVRFQVEHQNVVVDDAFAGQHVFDVAEDCGDFLILRKDKVPSYQLAVVVDDAVEGISEIVRGDDLLPSAARQQLLQRDLGYVTPRLFHVPLVVDPGGNRFAKRTDALSLRGLRERGICAESIVGWVARESGMPMVERARPRELIAAFDWSRVPHRPVTFDPSLAETLLR